MTSRAPCIIAVVVLLSGCQSSWRPGGNGAGDKPYPSSYPGDVKREVLTYVKAHPPSSPTIYTDEPTDIRHPGLWPFKNKRVYWVYHDRLPDHPNKGFYAALIGHPDDVKQQSASNAGGGVPVPTSQPTPTGDLLIYQGWIYVNGDRPRVGTRAVIAQATGCAILIYFHPGVNGLRQRVCCLEGDPDSGLWAFSGDGESSYYVPVGSFIELETNSDGTFKAWLGDSTGQYVRTLDTIIGDVEHLRVMEAVQAGQYEYEVAHAAPPADIQAHLAVGELPCVEQPH